MSGSGDNNFFPVRYGMVGGGPPGWIGHVHRMACSLDGTMVLVAGCFSSDPEKSSEIGKKLNIHPSRIYKNYQEMAEVESKLPIYQRIMFVSVVTPNTQHFHPVKVFLEHGFHVVCDKPLTPTLKESEILYTLSKKKNLLLSLTHTYSGYPMMKQAKHMINQGDLGPIRKVVVQYAQGWLSKTMSTITTSKGVSSLADVGSHAYHTIRYMTGLEVEQLVSDISTFVGGIREPDDFNILLRFKGGARGMLIASQSSTGEENDLRIHVYGEKGMIEWHQECPSQLKFSLRDQPVQILTRGKPYLSDFSKKNERLPPGHPEGYIEAFANIYVNFSNSVRSFSLGKKPNQFDLDFPTAVDGCYWSYFESKVLESFEKKQWVMLDYKLPILSKL